MFIENDDVEGVVVNVYVTYYGWIQKAVPVITSPASESFSMYTTEDAFCHRKDNTFWVRFKDVQPIDDYVVAVVHHQEYVHPDVAKCLRQLWFAAIAGLLIQWRNKVD